MKFNILSFFDLRDHFFIEKSMDIIGQKRLKMSLKDNGGIILPLNHYALGNSGGEGIFYAENGI